MMPILLAKVTIVLAAALVATRLAHRSSAAVRHVLLAAAFAVLLALPLASVLVPAIPVVVPAAVQERVPAQFFEEMPSNVLPVAPANGALAGVEAEIDPEPGLRFALSTLLLAVWVILSAVFLLPVGAGLWQMRVLRKAGIPWPEGQLILDTLAAESGVHRRIAVLLHEAVSGPMTCGVGHPAVLLPANVALRVLSSAADRAGEESRARPGLDRLWSA